ncbi:hypothetical protein SAMN04488029_1901 [Reichenbachiella faecimaris]|uniref:Uncharacterized protein n=1 Tax=Reichenbachiella faecimaris TaxID=692418 RepID=A0A1W2GC05_REIFA|nr:hypothetical protein [Reichenbachiella faecimaris]SMD34209.1 hypothetical protein SAMN04488029_1901 [Reichenbachiella faecimaris]
MITTFTENDLLRYLYDESSDNEKTDIENALVCDSELEARFFDLKLDSTLLDELFFDPADFTLEKIFSFSSNYSSSR